MPDTTTLVPLTGAETGNLAAGLVTAPVGSAPGAAKVEVAVEHGAEVFEQHTPGLRPVLDGAHDSVRVPAETHGLDTVVEFLEHLSPFLAQLGHHRVTGPDAGPAQTAS